MDVIRNSSLVTHLVKMNNWFVNSFITLALMVDILIGVKMHLILIEQMIAAIEEVEDPMPTRSKC